MEAIVCFRTGKLPATLSGDVDASASGTVQDSNSAELAGLVLDHCHTLPAPEDRLFSSGRYVRIRVAAASLNFADVLTVLGQYQERPPLPFIPGAEVSGVVTEVGPAVHSVRVSDRVCAVVGTGGFAEEVVTDESRVFLLPRGCPLGPSAALPVAFGTAHVALAHRANLQAGEVLLVLGAGGGVGLAAVQLGKVLGARVIAVAGGEEKGRMLRQAGADAVVDSKAGGDLRSAVQVQLKAWAKERGAEGEGSRARGQVDPKVGVDVVFDPVGGKLLQQSLRLAGWGARILIIGFASGSIVSVPSNIALVKNLTVHGIYWGSYMTHSPAVLRESMALLLRWLADGAITIHVSHQLPLHQVLEAFRLLQERSVIGKILLLPSNAQSRL